MGTMINGAKEKSSRIAVQLVSAAGLNIPWLRGTCFGVAVPMFNCHGCPWAVFACPVGILVNFATLALFPFVTLGIIIASAALAGRAFCGWLCPFGLLQELLYRIPTRKLKIARPWRMLKYFLFVLFVFLVPFMLPGAAATFCHLCPVGTLEGSLLWRLMGYDAPYIATTLLRYLVLIFTLILVVFVSRGFCRVGCPLGAMLGLFNRFALLRMRFTADKCTSCGVCRRVCPVDIDPVTEINHAECVVCGKCARPQGCLRLGWSESGKTAPAAENVV